MSRRSSVSSTEGRANLPMGNHNDKNGSTRRCSNGSNEFHAVRPTQSALANSRTWMAPANKISASIAAALVAGRAAAATSASIPRSFAGPPLWLGFPWRGALRDCLESCSAAPSRIQEHMHRTQRVVSFSFGTFRILRKGGFARLGGGGGLGARPSRRSSSPYVVVVVVVVAAVRSS